MALRALGEVKPASTTTGLRATNNAVALLGQPITQNYTCKAIQFQALSTNTGDVYICDRATPNLTLNVHGVVPPPGTDPATYPFWGAGDGVPGNFNAAELWIVPAVAGEGVRVTVIR